MTLREPRPRRSCLATPGSNVEMVAKAARSTADEVFIDLEDAVAAAQKEAARDNVVEALAGLDWGASVRAFRVNAVDTPWCHGDVISVVSRAGAFVDVVIVPKVRSPRDVWFVDDLLTQVEQAAGLPVGRIGLEALIEEAAGLAAVEAIAGSSPRLEALVLGFGDLAASQGMRIADVGGGDHGYPGDIWHYHRNRVFGAARAHGLDPVDGPVADFRDADLFRREAEWASTLGASGKWCIHPSQIEPANEVFAPSPAEIDRATAVARAVRAAEGAGTGSASLDGVMIDAASARLASATLSRARSAGLLPESG